MQIESNRKSRYSDAPMPFRRRSRGLPGLLLVGCLLAGCASYVRFPSSALDEAVLTAALYRPERSPRPAVVLLHTCGGVAPFVHDWARWLQGEGYVALVLDSFAPRGATNCQGRNHPGTVDVAADAFGALHYLRSLPFVDGTRIGVMGFSYGGNATLLVSGAGFYLRGPAKEGFQAAVALYPNCGSLSDTTTPLLMLLAGADDQAPAEVCISVGETLQRDKRPVRWVVYPSATHGFDQPGPPRTYGGHYMAYDTAATADSQKQVRQFLAEFLR